MAQIAMLKGKFVLEEQWITIEQFNRIYAFYQICILIFISQFDSTRTRSDGIVLLFWTNCRRD